MCRVWRQVTGAVVRKESTDYCDVVSVHYSNENEWEKGGIIGEHTMLKYVTNHAKQTLRSGNTIEEFENYVTRVHDRFITQKTEPTFKSTGKTNERFRSWDHWLDSHIGVKYGGADDALNASEITQFNELCFKTGEELTATLVTDNIPVSVLFYPLNMTRLSPSGPCIPHRLCTLCPLFSQVGKRFVEVDGDHYYSGTSFPGAVQSSLFV